LKKGVLIIFLSLLFSEVFSQSIDYGLAVTGNSSSYGVKRSAAQRKNFNYPLNYGASAGISLRYSPSKQQISRKFPFEPTFQSEAKLSLNNLLIKSDNDRINLLQEFYEITRFEFSMAVGVVYKRKFQLLIGPTFNTIITAQKTVDYRDQPNRMFPESDADFKRFGIGFNTSFGYLWKNFHFSVQYERQLTDFRTTWFNNSVQFKMNTLRIGTVFYLFNKNNEKNRASLFGL
jgi:hypothetical protein